MLLNHDFISCPKEIFIVQFLLTFCFGGDLSMTASGFKVVFCHKEIFIAQSL